MTPDKPITLNEHAKYQNAKFWFQSILDRTTGPHVNPIHPNVLFYILDDDVIFKNNQKTWLFWVDYDTIWSIFEYRFGMRYDDIQALIKSMVKDHYNLKSAIPFTIFDTRSN